MSMHIPQALSLDQNNVTLCLTLVEILTIQNIGLKRGTRGRCRLSLLLLGSDDCLCSARPFGTSVDPT